MVVYDSRWKPSMPSTQHTNVTTPMLKYDETTCIRVPQLAAAILYCDVIWHKAYNKK